jgi:hypothetical protein
LEVQTNLSAGNRSIFIMALEPFMPAEERDFFLSFLHRPSTRLYYEFGSGGSTAEACRSPNVEQVYSMESDTGFYESTLLELTSNKLQRTLVEVGCRNNWGYPAPGQDGSLYFSQIDALDSVPDLILVDGRWRVACALHAWAKMGPSSVLLFDDYYGRPHYFAVAPYFEKIGSAGRMIAFARGAMAPPADLIRAYESDPR